MYKDLNIEYLGISGRQNELIELTLSHGFKGFNLDVEQFAQQVERDGIDAARRLIDSARLRLSTFRLPVDVDTNEPDYQAQLESLKATAELAASVGCKVCRAVAPPAGDDTAAESTRRLPGETGKIDAVAYLRLLAERDYEGPVTSKAHPSQFEGLSRDAIAKKSGEAIDQVWQATELSRKGKLVPAS